MQSTMHARIPVSLNDGRLFIPALFLPIPASLKNTALRRIVDILNERITFYLPPKENFDL